MNPASHGVGTLKGKDRISLPSRQAAESQEGMACFVLCTALLLVILATCLTSSSPDLVQLENLIIL